MRGGKSAEVKFKLQGVNLATVISMLRHVWYRRLLSYTCL